jgi:tetratricopeptide (TPR) repeat protein
MQIYKQIILHNFLVFFFISLNPIVGQEKDKKEIDSIVKGINAQTGIQKLASFDYLFDNYKRKDPQLVLNHIDQAVELAENLGDSQASINFYKYKGTSNSFTGKTQQAIKSFNTAINKAAVLKDTVLQAKSIHALGSHYNRIGNYKEAEIQYIKAKKLAQKVGCQKILLQTDYNLGTLFINRGLDKKAKEIFERLLAQCPISALDCNGILLNNAICTYKLGNPSKALDMLFEVKKIDEINEHHLRVQYSNHHIAYILESVGLYEEALIYYDEVLNYFNGQADLRQQVAVNGTIGVLMMKLGRYKESKTYLQKSLILQKENGMSAYGRTLIDLGKLTFQQELIDQATSYYKKRINEDYVFYI